MKSTFSAPCGKMRRGTLSMRIPGEKDQFKGDLRRSAEHAETYLSTFPVDNPVDES
jgi:hypothetical protein